MLHRHHNDCCCGGSIPECCPANTGCWTGGNIAPIDVGLFSGERWLHIGNGMLGGGIEKILTPRENYWEVTNYTYSSSSSALGDLFFWASDDGYALIPIRDGDGGGFIGDIGGSIPSPPPGPTNTSCDLVAKIPISPTGINDPHVVVDDPDVTGTSGTSVEVQDTVEIGYGIYNRNEGWFSSSNSPPPTADSHCSISFDTSIEYETSGSYSYYVNEFIWSLDITTRSPAQCMAVMSGSKVYRAEDCDGTVVDYFEITNAEHFSYVVPFGSGTGSFVARIAGYGSCYLTPTDRVTANANTPWSSLTPDIVQDASLNDLVAVTPSFFSLRGLTFAHAVVQDCDTGNQYSLLIGCDTQKLMEIGDHIQINSVAMRGEVVDILHQDETDLVGGTKFSGAIIRNASQLEAACPLSYNVAVFRYEGLSEQHPSGKYSRETIMVQDADVETTMVKGKYYRGVEPCSGGTAYSLKLNRFGYHDPALGAFDTVGDNDDDSDTNITSLEVTRYSDYSVDFEGPFDTLDHARRIYNARRCSDAFEKEFRFPTMTPALNSSWGNLDGGSETWEIINTDVDSVVGLPPSVKSRCGITIVNEGSITSEVGCP